MEIENDVRAAVARFYRINGFDIRSPLGAWRAAEPAIVQWSKSIRGELAVGRIGGRVLVSINERSVSLARARYLVFAKVVAPLVARCAGLPERRERQLAAMLALPDEQIDAALVALDSPAEIAERVRLPRSLVELRVAERTRRPTAVYVPGKWAVVRGDARLPSDPDELDALARLPSIRLRKAVFAEEPGAPRLIAA